jgi:hypothetical protein
MIIKNQEAGVRRQVARLCLLIFLVLTPTFLSSDRCFSQGGQYTPVPHQFLTGFNAFGRPIGAQPVIADLSDTAWTAYTPTLACASGTLTTASAAGRSKAIGKTTSINIIVTITTNGTCAGFVAVGLPVTSNNAAILSGRENAVTGKMLQGIAAAGAASFALLNYDGTYPGANGATFIVTGILESQ